MKTTIKFRRSWRWQFAFFELPAAMSFGLLALPLAATALNKAQPGRTVAIVRVDDRRSSRNPSPTNRRATVPVRAIVVPHVAPIVTSTNDSGPGSLRQALADAQDGDAITFNISPATPARAQTSATVIALTSGELVVNNNITLSGPGVDILTIARSANASPFRIFKISSGHTVSMEGLTISGGLAQGAFPSNAGGGIYNDHSTVTLSGCALSGNSASFGGAIFSNALTSGTAALTLNNSTVTNNSAGNSGGGIFSDGENFGNATLALSASTVSGNTAIFGGGGIYSSAQSGSATMTVSNSTFSGNSANSFAGGIYNDGFAGNAVLVISNSTFTGNSASSGGAIYMDGANSGVAKLDIGNSILNAGAFGSNLLNNSGTVISHGYNLCSDSSPGFIATADQMSTDPMLGPLKNNGGPTLTHAPLLNSPAIDQGKRKTVALLTTDLDQRGSTRPINDPSVASPSGGDGSDIGAVELAVGVHPANAASSMTHGEAGSFAINLPLTGLGIECRSGGADNDYQMIVNFSQPVTFSSARVTSGVGAVSTMSTSSGSGGTQVTINLTGVTDTQIITVALFDVDDGTKHSDVGIRMGVLIGDTNDSGNVSSSDVSLAKLQSGQPVGADNFRADVIANGAINASDISAVKSKSGTGLP